MANVKISELTALTTPAAADTLVIVDDSEASGEKTKYITHANYQAGVLTHATALPVTIAGTSQLSFKDGVVEPTTNNDVDLGNETGPLRFKDVNISGTVRCSGIAQGKDVTLAIHKKRIQIGDWNMDSTNYVNVAHGLTISKIVDVRVNIIDDTSASLLPLDYTSFVGGVTRGSGAWIAEATNIQLTRSDSSYGGIFDNTSYDSTSFNRGWIIIEYVD